MSEEPIRNPMRQTPLCDIIDARYSRRDLLRGGAKVAAVAAAATALRPVSALANTHSKASASTLTFREVSKSTSTHISVSHGYDYGVLIRWGDRIYADGAAFDPLKQTAEKQLSQFGFNNDFLAYMPFPQGSDSSEHGLLCSNHEYTSTHLMFPGMKKGDAKHKVTKEQVEIELAAHGHGVLEVKRHGDKWVPVLGSPYNRRINPYQTKVAMAGPAASSPRVRTAADPHGTEVMGTMGNCAGGVTPWGSVLVCEENFNGYFGGDPSDTPEAENHKRYGITGRPWFGWHRHVDRFNVEKEANEPNRFGWVVEYDPYNPERKPVKRSFLGRFKHETATVTLAPDGRVVVYSGDDERFEYIYRFVSKGTYNADDREANFGLLDEGVLSVAKFEADGTFEWLPMVFGEGPLTEANGFTSQGDVLIESRRAGDLLGGTPMDRPEGIAVHSETGHVYVSLTNNNKRKEGNAVNTRANNIHGHILEMIPPAKDHAANQFEWKLFLQGGNPEVEADDAFYGGDVSKNGWLSCPDNLSMDPAGRLWIATDGQDESIGKNDGLYAADVTGEAAGETRMFLSGPAGCEITGPCFTPDGTTLFVAIQHPGDGDNKTFTNPATRWPDFKESMPPRPSVIAVRKKNGGVIGS